MGEKQRSVRAGATATENAVRIAKLTIEPSTNEEQGLGQLQKLMKKVIETTRCTAAQAEVALYDNDNDVERAVHHILDSNGAVESWTEQKSRKTKKEEKEEKEEARRLFLSSKRSERPHRGASTGGSRGGRGGSHAAISSGNSELETASGPVADRGGFRHARGASLGGGRGSGRGRANMRNHNSTASQRVAVPPPVEEETNWKSGAVFTRSSDSQYKSEKEDAPAASSSGTASTSHAVATAGPISFAAVAAAAARKTEVMPQPQAEEKRFSVDRSLVGCSDEMNGAEETEVEGRASHEMYQQEEDLDALRTSPMRPTEPEQSANLAESWAQDLKTTLGIGRPAQQQEESPIPGMPSSSTNSISIQSTPQAPPAPRQRVEFVEIGGSRTTGAALTHDYHFGFSADLPESPPPPTGVSQAAPSLQHQQQPAASLAAVTAAAQVAQQMSQPTSAVQQTLVQTSQVDTRPSGDLTTLKASPPAYGGSNATAAARSLGYDAASTVNYQPSMASYGMDAQKSYSSQQQQLQQQQQQQQQQQSHVQRAQQAPSLPNQQHQAAVAAATAAMFQPPMYNNYPYMNMYSPVAGSMRNEEYAALMQYPFNLGNPIDLSAILPQGALTGQSTQQPTRADHTDMSKAYGAASMGSAVAGNGSRADSIAPPPGFPAANQYNQFTQHSLSTMLLQQQQQQQQYSNPHGFNFMVPSVNAGISRSMYEQEDSRRGNEQARIGGLKDQRVGTHQAQPTPPPQHHFQQQQHYLNSNAGMAKKPYQGNWNN